MSSLRTRLYAYLTSAYTKEAGVLRPGTLRAAGVGAGLGAGVGAGAAYVHGRPISEGALIGAGIGGLGAAGLRARVNKVIGDDIAHQAYTRQLYRGGSKPPVSSPVAEAIQQHVDASAAGLMNPDNMRLYEAAERWRAGVHGAGDSHVLAAFLARHGQA